MLSKALCLTCLIFLISTFRFPVLFITYRTLRGSLNARWCKVLTLLFVTLYSPLPLLAIFFIFDHSSLSHKKIKINYCYVIVICAVIVDHVSIIYCPIEKWFLYWLSRCKRVLQMLTWLSHWKLNTLFSLCLLLSIKCKYLYLIFSLISWVIICWKISINL